MSAILVFGHQNPDNDSVCSAVGYAHLRNVVDPGNVYLPARLGPVPPETRWVFERFGVEPPEEIAHVHARVRDVMTADPICVAPDATMLRAGAIMRERGLRSLPVVDEGGVRGLVNTASLAERYLEAAELADFRRLPVTVGRLADALEGEVRAGDREGELSGGVLIAAMEPESVVARIEPGDTLIVGDRRRTQPMALEAGVACLIVTGGSEPDPAVLELAAARGSAVIVTPLSTYAAARRTDLAHDVAGFMSTDVLRVDPDALLTEAVEDLLASRHREALVVDPDGSLAGVLTRSDVAQRFRRKVVLVDHNERAQSAPGIEDAEVVEIVDHHRVGDIETAGPILFLGLPVGATATIVASRYREFEVTPPTPVAGLLLSAIMSDTVMLKSPTTTGLDREIAEWLEPHAGIGAAELGMAMFHARTAGASFSARGAVRGDLKEYRIGESVVAVSQVETVDAGEVLAHEADLRAEMERLREEERAEMVLLMVTDVVREGTELLAVGKTRLAERAFGMTFDDGRVWLPGVLSRKKQVASRLVDAVS